MAETALAIRPERIEQPLYAVGERVLVTDRFTLNHSEFYWKGTVREVCKNIICEHSPRGSVKIYYGIDYDESQNNGRTPPRWVFQSGVSIVATIQRLCDVVNEGE